MINLSQSLPIIWMLFVIPSCVLSVDERYIRCFGHFSCGNITDLSYPFWTPGREECGHPDFKVDCSEDFPEFNISSVKFQILEMNYSDQFIRLAIMDYRNNLCPRDPENAIINQQVLPFAQDTELRTFYYNCSGPTVGVLPGYIKEIECGEEIGGQSYCVSSPTHPGNKAFLEELSASCERNVTIPVSRSAMKTAAERNQSLVAIKKALDDGFKLIFNSDCAQCEASYSHAACGRDVSSTAFVCYCEDGPHEHTCPSEIAPKIVYSFPCKESN